jgi:hypothetical protein
VSYDYESNHISDPHLLYLPGPDCVMCVTGNRQQITGCWIVH